MPRVNGAMRRSARPGLRGVAMLAAPVLLVAALSRMDARSQDARLDVRFHHFHVMVADPALALASSASRLGAPRKILQGHGPGVRAGSEYLVFDREDERLVASGDSRLYLAPVYAANVFGQTVRWAADHGLIAAPAEFSALRIAEGLPNARIGSVAFSAADPSAVVGWLRGRGVEPFERSPDLARYRLSAELVVEIVGETDRPDTHWCPMHPDVRASGPATCSLCGMDLVRIPPPKIGEYGLDVAVASAREAGGALRLRFVVRDPESGEPVRQFIEVHERLFHLFVISRDLARFEHVHPHRREDGSFELTLGLEAGEYVLIADFLPAGGTPQMVHRAIVTPTYTARLFEPPPRPEATPPEQTAGGLRVRLDTPDLAPLKPSTLRFIVSDASTGQPVTDLEPYLGASGHLLVVSPDLTAAIHGHPEGPFGAGPVVTFDPILPRAGLYKLWVQFQRGGGVITVPFVIEVPPT
jgi:hypothetical protein